MDSRVLLPIRITTFLLLCFLGAAVKAAGPPPSDPKAILRQAVKYCPGGLERILPGEYYFCAAARDFGRGRTARATARLRDAAHWASKPAQYILGLMYFNGDEGPANRPLGVAWLALAAERHDPRFEGAFVKAYLESTPSERARANDYWRELRGDYGDPVAGTRARRLYLAEMRNLMAASMFGGSIFIDGLTPPNGAAVGQFGDGSWASRAAGQSGFSVERTIAKAGDEYFHGMVGTVTVGEVQPEQIPMRDLVNGTATLSH
jgi:hypothetical protein